MTRTLAASIIAAACFCILPGAAGANDTTAVLEGGHLTLTKSATVSMESEDLLISPSKVHVAYVFRNRGSTDLDTRVAFPLREKELDPVDDLARFREEIGFRLTIDGVERHAEHEIKRSNGFLLVTYHWEQTFPAGRPVTVVHEYVPHGGFIIPRPDYPYEGWQKVVRDYCMEPRVAAWTRRAERSAQQVHYVLRTGANWNGPIGHFRLTIRKTKATDKVTLCLDGIKRVNETDSVIEKKDFLPKTDLRILFVDGDG